MQKTNTHASILLWSIFLSLMIMTTFLGISTKINKNLKYNLSIKDNAEIQDTLNTAAAYSLFSTQELANGMTIEFDDPNYLLTSLKKYEEASFTVNPASNVTIMISQGNPLYFEHSTGSGIITHSRYLPNISGAITLKNLGGYSKINLHSSEGVMKSEHTYRITKKIGNMDATLSQGSIKSF